MGKNARSVTTTLLICATIIIMGVCSSLAHVHAQDGGPPTAKSANDYILDGLDLYYRGLWRDALEAFDTAKHLDATFGIKLDSNPQALAELMSKNMFSPHGDFITAIAGNYNSAVEAANEVLKQDSTDSRNYYRLGLAYIQLNLPVPALEALNHAIQYYPDSSATYVARGRLYVLIQNLPQALEDFDHAIKLDPGNIVAFDYRSRTRVLQNDWDGVIDDYRAIQKLDPNYPNAKAIQDRILDRAGYSFRVLIVWSLLVAVVVSLGKGFLTRTAPMMVQFRSVFARETLPIFALLITVSVLSIVSEQTGLIIALRQRMLTLLLLGCLAALPSVYLLQRMMEIRRLIGATHYDAALIRISNWRRHPIVAWLLKSTLDRLETSALMYSGRFAPAENVLRGLIAQAQKTRSGHL